jgi:hypothetical protein
MRLTCTFSRVAIVTLALAVCSGYSGALSQNSSTADVQCLPPLPSPQWSSPYAGWSRGPSNDPGYFPIGVWLQGSWHAAEMAQLGINLYVGNNAATNALAAGDLSTLKNHGISAIVGQDSVGLAHINDPTIVGWWMDPDEPDNKQPNRFGVYGRPADPSTLATKYTAFKSADPTRPVLLGLGQGVAYDNWEGRGSDPPPESAYVPNADIVAFDIYPYNACGRNANEKAICGQFWLNAFGIDRLFQWSTHHQAVWTWIETTPMNGGYGPTPAQTASEVWLALIHGANGIGYFVHVLSPSFREDGIFANPDMVRAVTTLNKQIRALAPQLNSASISGLVTVSGSNPAAPIDFMVKTDHSALYIFAAVSRSGTADATFSIAGMSSNGSAQVLNENRQINITAGRFSDSFIANSVHLYKIQSNTPSCN